MRGASALQRVLSDVPEAGLQVFVVWESVLRQDVAAPTTKVMNRISDNRVAQFWDRDRLLSLRIATAAVEDPEGILWKESCSFDTVIWDWVAIYAPGVRWDDSFPQATFAGAPVNAVIDDFQKALSRIVPSTS